MKLFFKSCIIFITIGILFLFIYMSPSVHARADKAADAGYIFYKGNALYEEGNYNYAIIEYSRLLEQNMESGHLYYNMGNAYFKQGELGKAILNYERAIRLIPRDSDLKSNYRFALSHIKANTSTISASWTERAVGVLGFLSLDELALLASCLLVLAVLLLIANSYIRMSPKTVSLLLASMVMLFALSLTSISLRVSVIDKEAVVLSDGPEVKFEPFESATTHFTLHEGMKISVLKSKPGWLKVKRSDGKSGWVTGNSAEII